MNRIARVGATGAVITLATLSLSPVAAIAKGGPSIAQNTQQDRVTASSTQTKAQLEYQERSQAALRLHYGVDPNAHPSKAQIEFNERSSAAVNSPSGTQGSPTTTGGGDAASWQLALMVAGGGLVLGGAVLASRNIGRRREALAS